MPVYCCTFFILSLLCFIILLYIFCKTYRDPRWRIFDFNSKQAAFSEIYQTTNSPVIRSIKLKDKHKMLFNINCDSMELAGESEKYCRVAGNTLEISPAEDSRFHEEILLKTTKDGNEKQQKITASFLAADFYRRENLSWPDNYAVTQTTIPFDFGRRHSVESWAGFEREDADIVSAREIMRRKNVELENKSTVERSLHIFRFIMLEMGKDSNGIPSDAMQDASPLATYEKFVRGESKGWCENRALVYYLFANAGGVKTRLIDLAGKFKAVKLTGHYFCESYDEQSGSWFMVDPQSNTACVRRNGKLLNTLEIKRLIDLEVYDSSIVQQFDYESSQIEEKDGAAFLKKSIGYYGGAAVIGYKFAYAKNKSFNRLKNFLFQPTLLYADFKIPAWRYHLKLAMLWGTVVFLILACMLHEAKNLVV